MVLSGGLFSALDVFVYHISQILWFSALRKSVYLRFVFVKRRSAHTVFIWSQ